MAGPRRIGEILLESGLISEEELARALEAKGDREARLGEILVEQGVLTERELARVLAEQLNLRQVSLAQERPDPAALALLPEPLIRRYQVLPIRLVDDRLLLAMADPLDYYALEDARLSSRRAIEPVVVARGELQAFIERYFDLRQSLEETMRAVEERRGRTEAPSVVVDDRSPTGRLLSQLVSQAVRSGASDVHFDPGPDGVAVRLRVDGMLRTAEVLPPPVYDMVASRVKVLAQLDITEHRLPQDGRIRTTVDGRPIDLRVAVAPVLNGQKTVLRILDPESQRTSLAALDLSPANLARLTAVLRAGRGLLIVAGPTGSGKTTTLYAALRTVASPEVNVMTIEDPVEFQIPGVNQMAVTGPDGLTFAGGLRAILRQDPDIVMIGEIRDAETAEITVRAALTGHLVLTTLHTLAAVETIARLVEMGVPRYLCASAVSAVVAQRLVRRVCPSCAAAAPLSAAERAWIEYWAEQEGEGLNETTFPVLDQSPRAVGCPACGGIGFRGRMAIHEVMVWDDDLRGTILHGGAEPELRAAARAQWAGSLIADGLSKVKAGLTTVGELMRMLGGDVG